MQKHNKPGDRLMKYYLLPVQSPLECTLYVVSNFLISVLVKHMCICTLDYVAVLSVDGGAQKVPKSEYNEPNFSWA